MLTDDFSSFKMVAIRHLRILTAYRVQRGNLCHFAKFRGDPSNAKFRGDRSNRCWVMAIFSIFQNGGRPPSWICCTRVSPTRKVFGGLYHCIEFGCNRCSNFDNMQVSVFCDFGLKMPIHDPYGFCGIWPPLSGELYQRCHKKIHLCAEIRYIMI